jgi:hypothetical protein
MKKFFDNIDELHEDVYAIRKMIESCKTIEQVDNLVDWLYKIFDTHDQTVNFYQQRMCFRDWLIFLAKKQKEKCF